MTRDSRTNLVLAAGVVMTLVSSAWAQRGSLPETRPSIEELVDRLDDPLFVVREEALRDLFEHPAFTIQQAEWLLTDQSLSPEQRLRLHRVAFAMFIRGPRAAMGVRFLQGSGDLPRIDGPVAEFPAAQMLQAGDLFLEADGLPILTQADMRAAILSRSPGDTIHVQVLRGGERLRLAVELGSFANLTGSAPPQTSDLLEAWRLREARNPTTLARGPLTPVVDEGARATRVPERGSEAWENVFATSDAPQWLVMGGQARESADLSLRQLAARDEARVRDEAELSLGRGNFQQQAAFFRAQLVLVEEEIRRVEARLVQTQENDPNRAILERALQDAQIRRMAFMEQIRALDAAARPAPPAVPRR